MTARMYGDAPVACLLCGQSCWIEEGCPADGNHGLVNVEVSGGYVSTPGNGKGALDDGTIYTFSLCEFCLDFLFARAKVPPVLTDICATRESRGAFEPAADRVQRDEWRKDKASFAAEAARRDAARWRVKL